MTASLIPGANAPPDLSGDNRASITDTLKKKRGRPTKAEELAKAQAEAAASTPVVREVFKPDMVEGVTNIPFGLCAVAFRNKEWNLDDSDKKLLAPPFADWLNELWPEISGKYPRLAVLLVMTGAVFVKKTTELAIKHQQKPVSPVPEKARPETPAQSLVPDMPGGNGLTATEQYMNNRSRMEPASA